MMSGNASGDQQSLLQLVVKWRLWILFAVLTLAGLLSSPFIFEPGDVSRSYIPWMLASDGPNPWKIYAVTPTPNYPPFVLLTLILLERVRAALNIDPNLNLTICLVKAPFLLAHSLGVLVCFYGVRRLSGERTAWRAALLYALCLPLFIDGALWGQTDALMMLAVLAAVLLLATDRPIAAGVAIGLALAIKTQAIVFGPFLLVYSLRRYGWSRTLAGIAAAAAVVLVLALPFIVNGYGKQVAGSYVGAVGYYRRLSSFGMNFWDAIGYVNAHYRSLPLAETTSDQRNAIAGITYQQLGFTLFGAYTLFLLFLLWRRPTPIRLLFTSAMGAYGLFMLATEMHERYVIPAIALLALVAVVSRRHLLLYVGSMLVASVNVMLVLLWLYLPNNAETFRLGTGVYATWLALLPFGCVANCVLFTFGTWLVAQPPPDADVLRPPSP